MASNKKAKYRSLINRLQSIASSIDGAYDPIDNIQPALDTGILFNDKSIEESVFPAAKTELETAKDTLYRAIRSCYNSMSKAAKEEEEE